MTVNNSDNNDNNTNNKIIRPKIQNSLRQFDKKKVAVYARVSRAGVMKHHSIEAQKNNLKTDIENHPGWVFADFYVDEGITGTKIDRPEFNRMMDDARAGKIDIIMTKTVSRFGRNVAAVLRVLQELKELGVVVIFDNEGINTADEDSLIRLQYNSIMAEREAKQNSDNKKWSVRNYYKKGIPLSGRPYGYKMINHQYQIIPEEAEVVKLIFNMYLSGKGKGAICKHLNSAGFVTKSGTKWNNTSVLWILQNEVYAGDLLLQKCYIKDFITKKQVKNYGELPMYLVEDAHKPIIDRDTFNRVQRELERRQKLYTTTKYHDKNKPRLMSHLVRCNHCGGSIYYKLAHGDKARKTWVCKTHIETGADYCPVKPIREDILVDNTREVLLSEKLIKNDTTLTNELLKKHIRVILANENYELEYHLYNGNVITKSCKCPSRSKSWTPEMKQRAREKTLARNAERKRGKK